ncbi:MAG: hypothetical protein QOG23_943 [Blastocatellia bacterium]|nr:hypothetical protein [Blastocatellia bacterium]
MKTRIALIVFCVLFTDQHSFRATQQESRGLALPTIFADCSLRTPHSTLEFSWQATNASYVLIKGRDKSRHPLLGRFSVQQQQGAFTFIAVAGNQIMRKPCICSRTYQPGNSGPDWVADNDPRMFPAFEDGYEIKITTSVSKGQLEDRIVQLARTEYGVVMVSRDESKDSIFLYTSDYGTHKSLCDFDGCKRNGTQVNRKIGFDILGVTESQAGDKAVYKLRIGGDILSRPAAGSEDWELDPNSDQVLKQISKRLGDEIAKASDSGNNR